MVMIAARSRMLSHRKVILSSTALSLSKSFERHCVVTRLTRGVRLAGMAPKYESRSDQVVAGAVTSITLYPAFLTAALMRNVLDSRSLLVISSAYSSL